MTSHPVDSWRGLTLESVKAIVQKIEVEVVE
jgi:hypothetical protein